MQLAPLGNSRCGPRTLQAWPGRYGAFFLVPVPFAWSGKNLVVVPILDRVRKDWFDVCLCLWIVKAVVLPGWCVTLLALQSFCSFSGVLGLLCLQV